MSRDEGFQNFISLQGLPENALSGAKSTTEKGDRSKGEQTTALLKAVFGTTFEPAECRTTGNY